MKELKIIWPPSFPFQEVSSHDIYRLFQDIIDPEKRNELERNATILAVIASRFLIALKQLSSELAVESQRAENMERLAERDRLTNLFLNIVFKEKLLSSLWSDRGWDPEKLCALFFLDLRKLKELNEKTIGYRKADLVLAKVGALIPKHIRSRERGNDIHGRLGGDEFGALIYNLTYEKILQIGRRFTQAIAGHSWKDEPGFDQSDGNLVVGVHVGVAFCRQEIIASHRQQTESMEQFERTFVHPLVDCAGKAVNQAKLAKVPVYRECHPDAP